MAIMTLGLVCMVAGFLAGLLWGSEAFKRRHAQDWRGLLENESST